MKPVLFVTNHVPPDRAGAFAALHAQVPLELALFGGRSHHATSAVEDPGVPHRHVAQHEVHALAASGDYAAVVCGTAGRVALPASLSGAARGGTPFVLWSALWGNLSTPAHLLARPLMRAAHRRAAVVVAYGPHVAAHARSLGARRVAIAPQAVDNAFWSAPTGMTRDEVFSALWVGRPAPEKGLDVLRAAWQQARLPGGAVLRLAGEGTPGGAESPAQLRNSYARSHVVVIASIASRRFREPWGLVANEAMNQRCAVIATDATGAAAGGLVRDGETGLVVPAGDAGALARALERLAGDAALRSELAERGHEAVGGYTHQAWADAFAGALREATEKE